MGYVKGQVVLFIIICLLSFILFIVLYLLLNPKMGEQHIVKDSSYNQVEMQIQSCLNSIATLGVYQLSNNGGYIYRYNDVLNTDNIQVAYHLQYQKRSSPKKEFMENELNRFITDSIDLCTIENSKTVKAGNAEAHTTINTNNVIINLQFPVRLKTENSETIISQFITIVPIPLGKVLEIKDKLISNINADDMIDLDYLSSQSAIVTVLPYDKENLVYSIYDQGVNSPPFVFNFAVKVKTNSAPRLDFIPDFVLTKGEEFVYQIQARDDDGGSLTYFTPDSTIAIEKNTGLLRYTPSAFGKYSIKICVRDRYLAIDCEDTKFMVYDK